MESEKVDSIVELAAKLAGKADEIDQVLIIYRYRRHGEDDDRQGSMDNGLELRDANWLIDGFKFWLQAGACGLLKRNEDGR